MEILDSRLPSQPAWEVLDCRLFCQPPGETLDCRLPSQSAKQLLLNKLRDPYKHGSKFNGVFNSGVF